jgi:hypothetical protein
MGNGSMGTTTRLWAPESGVTRRHAASRCSGRCACQARRTCVRAGEGAGRLLLAPDVALDGCGEPSKCAQMRLAHSVLALGLCVHAVCLARVDGLGSIRQCFQHEH